MINQKMSKLFQFYIMRCFSSPETFIKYYISKNGGSIKLNDGTWVVNQSDEFHSYCYNEGYNAWKKNQMEKEILKEKLLDNFLKQTNIKNCTFVDINNKLAICCKVNGICGKCNFYLKQ